MGKLEPREITCSYCGRVVPFTIAGGCLECETFFRREQNIKMGLACRSCGTVTKYLNGGLCRFCGGLK